MVTEAQTIDIEGSLEMMEQHLASRLRNTYRQDTFDMDDVPEAQVLASFPGLKAALQWTEENVTVPWRAADAAALHSQSEHRLLARVAISAGVAAIVLAIVHLAVNITARRLIDLALALEVLAVVAAVVAVTVGLRAKFNHQWLGQRHRAEQLRKLKFSALVQLSIPNPGWQRGIAEKLQTIDNVLDFARVEDWSKGGDVDPEMPTVSNSNPQSGDFRAVVLYYRYKRILFQADYFKRRREDYQRETGGWRHRADLPAFFLSVFFVLAHFAAQLWSAYVHQSPGLEKAAIWCVALAAIIPVLGVGAHAWVDAFELPRSASLFAAKHRALLVAATRLQQDSGDVLATLGHMCRIEHFLEHEHREWLRLLLDAKWFI